MEAVHSGTKCKAVSLNQRGLVPSQHWVSGATSLGSTFLKQRKALVNVFSPSPWLWGKSMVWYVHFNVAIWIFVNKKVVVPVGIPFTAKGTFSLMYLVYDGQSPPEGRRFLYPSYVIPHFLLLLFHPLSAVIPAQTSPSHKVCLVKEIPSTYFIFYNIPS